MPEREYLFTSESVTEGHPDKVADQLSDTILDAVLKDDPDGRVACETLVTTGIVIVAGEITTDTYIDIPKLVRQKVAEIGYTRSDFGFDAHTCGVVVAIDGSRRTSPRASMSPTRCSTTPATTIRSTGWARATRG